MEEDPNSLKSRIHNFRLPLSARGRVIAGFFYVTVPLLGGYMLMKLLQPSPEQQRLQIKEYEERARGTPETQAGQLAIQKIFDDIKRNSQDKQK